MNEQVITLSKLGTSISASLTMAITAKANELKQQGVSEFVIAQLIGHSNSSITMGRYGKDYDVEVLSSVVEQLRVP